MKYAESITRYRFTYPKTGEVRLMDLIDSRYECGILIITMDTLGEVIDGLLQCERAGCSASVTYSKDPDVPKYEFAAFVDQIADLQIEILSESRF